MFYYMPIMGRGKLVFPWNLRTEVEIRKLIQGIHYTSMLLPKIFYNDRFERANDFLRNAMYDKNDERYKICSFHLHQACENYYNSIILTFTLYSPKEHSLITLSGRAKTHSLESSEAFPRDTEEEKRLFDLLQDAYVQARYNLHFRVTKEDIEALIPKVERLRDITRQCCEERIKVYAAKQRQV